MKKNKLIRKVVSGILAACMVTSTSCITAFAADLTDANTSGTATVQYTVDSSWQATIPTYINPSEQGNADVEKYSVTLSDVMLGSDATLVGTVEYNGKLVEANDVELGYVLCDENGEIVTDQEIIYADAGSPNSTTSYNFGAELTEKPKYAGNYLGTATFNFVANERVFAIGETKPENVIAKFNEDYSQVDIFTAGNDSDGIMRDFNGDSPMQIQAASLETATIEDGVTTISSKAFNGCNNLISVAIPDSVTSIADDSFNDCDSLNTVYGSYDTLAEDWADNNNYNFVSTTVYTTEDIENDEHLLAIGETKPEYVVAKFNDDFTEVTIFANGDDSDGRMMDFNSTNNSSPMTNHCNELSKVIYKENVKNIGNYAFYDCSMLLNIDVPNSVTSIGKNAFQVCTSLESVTIPDSVISIGSSAFQGCASLKNITIPNNITSIGKNAFYYCSSLKNINIPNGVISIDEKTFYYCSSLESVTIPNSVTSIGDAAFNGCSSLKNINIPDSVISIGQNAFGYCSLLENIIIPNSVTSISTQTFADCTSLESIIIPNSVTSIGLSAFYGCSSLNNVNIPDSVISIGRNAFYKCSSLDSITIPESVTSIGDYAFAYCTSLKSATISNSVTSIDEKTFNYCTSLESITIPNSVTYIGNGAFYKCTNLKTIYGNTGSYAETWANSKDYTFVAID